jgi:hypothetical protein
MKIVTRSGALLLLLLFSVAACSALVGADFDGLVPAGSGGTSGGPSASGGSGGGGLNSAGNDAAAGVSSGGGSSQGGSAGSGPTAGAFTGGAPADGGADPGGAAGTGDGAAGDGGSGAVGVPPSAVVLNELKGQGTGDDYIELFNTGDETADIGGCYVADDSNNRVIFPTGATIGAKSYVVVRLQQATSTGMVTTCFGFTPCYNGVTWGISAGGEVIFLHDSQGVLLDQLTYPDDAGPNGVGDTHALGRIPDGAETTGAVLISPGTTNNAVQ